MADRLLTFKCLGIEPDGTLTWITRISDVLSKLRKVFGALERLVPHLLQHSLKLSIYR